MILGHSRIFRRLIKQYKVVSLATIFTGVGIYSTSSSKCDEFKSQVLAWGSSAALPINAPNLKSPSCIKYIDTALQKNESITAFKCGPDFGVALLSSGDILIWSSAQLCTHKDKDIASKYFNKGDEESSEIYNILESKDVSSDSISADDLLFFNKYTERLHTLPIRVSPPFKVKKIEITDYSIYLLSENGKVTKIIDAGRTVFNFSGLELNEQNLFIKNIYSDVNDEILYRRCVTIPRIVDDVKKISSDNNSEPYSNHITGNELNKDSSLKDIKYKTNDLPDLNKIKVDKKLLKQQNVFKDIKFKNYWFGEKVLSIATGSNHALFLTKHNLYAEGCNEYNQLAKKTDTLQFAENPISITSRVPFDTVTDIRAGGNSSAVLTNNGILSWGSDSCVTLGHGATQSQLHTTEYVKQARTTGFTRGESHIQAQLGQIEEKNTDSVVLTRRYSATDKHCTWQPTPVREPSMLKGEAIAPGAPRDIVLGRSASFFDVADKKISTHELSRQSLVKFLQSVESKDTLTPDEYSSKLKECEQKVKLEIKNEDIPNSRIYASGKNDFGQCGCCTGKHIVDFGLVQLPMSSIKVYAGVDSALAIVNSERIYIWGKNKFGECGVSTCGLRYKPVDITYSLIHGPSERLRLYNQRLDYMQSIQANSSRTFKRMKNIVNGSDEKLVMPKLPKVNLYPNTIIHIDLSFRTPSLVITENYIDKSKFDVV